MRNASNTLSGQALSKTLALLCLALLPLAAQAENAEEKGLAIAQEADRRDTGWGDMTAGLKMVLRNRHGEESTREIRSRSLEVDGDGDKTLSIFDSPLDVKGTAFLSFTHATRPDEQWLYLPALKRVKRISSNNKSGPFMGSEFAYEDLTSPEVAKYTYRFVREESIDGRPAFVIERLPAYKHSGYTRLLTWLDKAMYQPLKVEFYDRKKALLKTLSVSDYQQFEDKFWRPAHMSMVNHQTGKSTELYWSDYRFHTGLSTRDFDRHSLKRAR